MKLWIDIHQSSITQTPPNINTVNWGQAHGHPELIHQLKTKDQPFWADPTEQPMQHKSQKNVNTGPNKKRLEHPVHDRPPCTPAKNPGPLTQLPNFTDPNPNEHPGMQWTNTSDLRRPHPTSHSTHRICCQCSGAREHSTQRNWGIKGSELPTRGTYAEYWA